MRGIEGYFDNRGEFEAIQRYNDPSLLQDLGIPDMALLNLAQVISVYFFFYIYCPLLGILEYFFLISCIFTHQSAPGKTSLFLALSTELLPINKYEFSKSTAHIYPQENVI